ncbi:MarR family winged helix-turn-helix transcriptional regulator [Acinetobacter brisouii]|uniref:MarR family winged helix-turn-helix transcriptional regulator n=1 Tax=Acinetobacter brisouii TaxID=396323 RepID=UPI0012506A73|nr:MarR family winged helix-turn-helix transcriptional regulator [Acinetobacter brisouii]
MTKKYAKYLPASDNIQINNFPFYWISQIHQKYVENVDHVLKKYGMDNSRRRVLGALLLKPNASVSELSEMLISKMSTTTKLVYRLKDEGYVNTYSCPEDARITRVVLTEKGQEILKKVNDLTGIVLEQAFTGLTPLQIEKLLTQLHHIFKNLSR